ncbi:MAG: tyrosine-type recombinase/integrase [Actinomycetota bacterium]|nr:tyrosine-type recombinase/integrase [Actinomycetota bacterium]
MANGTAAPRTGDHEAVDFGYDVRAYPPSSPGGYWRIRWEEAGRRRDTTAKDRAAAMSKANEIVERLTAGASTDLGGARGADLVAHYLDPGRDMPRGRPWSMRHREAQESFCRRFVTPEIGPIECRRLTRNDTQRVLDKATTPSNADHLRRCLTALVNAGLDGGYLLARQDLMRGVRWSSGDGAAVAGAVECEGDEWDVAVTADDIPPHEHVHAIACAAAARTGVWWRELELLLTAYSGVRWGEHAALVGRRVRRDTRRIEVWRQAVETNHDIHFALPKGRKRRTTIYPEMTPCGVDLAVMVERRIAEVGPDSLLFPSPRGMVARRSNYRRNVLVPAARDAGWPVDDEGNALWTFHSLRHVFATWLLSVPGVTIEDVSRLMGHSSTRITQEVYVHFLTARLDQLFAATAA